MSTKSPAHSLLQAYSVLAISLAAGTNLSTTIVTLPALLHAPSTTLAPQWKILFDSGFTPVVSLAMSSAAGFALLAYQSAHATRSLYAGAAVAAFGLVPYTKVLMGRNIDELERRAKGVGEGAGRKEDTHELVRTWGRYNFWRGVMLLSSAGMGVWACVS